MTEFRVGIIIEIDKTPQFCIILLKLLTFSYDPFLFYSVAVPITLNLNNGAAVLGYLNFSFKKANRMSHSTTDKDMIKRADILTPI